MGSGKGRTRRAKAAKLPDFSLRGQPIYEGPVYEGGLDPLVLKDGTKKWHKEKKLHREDGPAIEWADGSMEWYIDGKKHRVDGPAVVNADGILEWYFEGLRHREGGPAVEYAPSTRNADQVEWWDQGQLHRVGGPAIECSDGKKEWRFRGELHREDGPAIIWGSDGAEGVEGSDGSDEYWIHGKKLEISELRNTALQEEIIGSGPVTF